MSVRMFARVAQHPQVAAGSQWAREECPSTAMVVVLRRLHARLPGRLQARMKKPSGDRLERLFRGA
jgi:hypothetical protein